MGNSIWCRNFIQVHHVRNYIYWTYLCSISSTWVCRMPSLRDNGRIARWARCFETMSNTSRVSSSNNSSSSELSASKLRASRCKINIIVNMSSMWISFKNPNFTQEYNNYRKYKDIWWLIVVTEYKTFIPTLQRELWITNTWYLYIWGQTVSKHASILLQVLDLLDTRYSNVIYTRKYSAIIKQHPVFGQNNTNQF